MSFLLCVFMSMLAMPQTNKHTKELENTQTITVDCDDCNLDNDNDKYDDFGD